MGFHWLDWLLFALLLSLSMCIGVFAWWQSRKERTTQEVLMGGRKMSVLPVSLSIFMSFVSAIMALGNAAEMYQHGVQMWLITFGYILGYLATAWFIVPVFYKMNVTSSFEYLEARFQTKVTRMAGDVLLLIYQFIYMGMATFAPATALNAATGFPVWAAIIIEIIIATFYTTLGGMKAVVWTDAIQALIFAAGIIAALIEGTKKVGSFGEVWEIAGDHGRLDLWNFNMNPYEDRLTFWSCLVGVFFTSLSTMGFQQTSVQRYCSLTSEFKARLSVLIIVPMEILMSTLTCLVGLVVFAYHTKQGCDPLRVEGKLDGSNQLLPDFITNVIAIPGLSGLFMAVLFSGALSTLSSSLNSLSAVVWKDFLEERFHYLEEGRKAIVTQLLVILFGAVAMAVAIAVQYMGVHVMQASSSLNSTAAGPLSGMFLVGMFFPWVNGIAAAIASITTLGVMMWISIGSTIADPHRSYLDTIVSECNLTANATVSPIPEDQDALFIYKMSFYWYDATGTTLTVLLSLLITFVTGFMNTKKINPQYIVNLFDLVCPCMPARWRNKLRCGVPTSEEYCEEQFDDEEQEEEKKQTADCSNNTQDLIQNGVMKTDYDNKAFESFDDNQQDYDTSFKEDDDKQLENSIRL